MLNLGGISVDPPITKDASTRAEGNQDVTKLHTAKTSNTDPEGDPGGDPPDDDNKKPPAKQMKKTKKSKPPSKRNNPSGGNGNNSPPGSPSGGSGNNGPPSTPPPSPLSSPSNSGHGGNDLNSH